jgi:hypothetical protein
MSGPRAGGVYVFSAGNGKGGCPLFALLRKGDCPLCRDGKGDSPRFQTAGNGCSPLFLTALNTYGGMRDTPGGRPRGPCDRRGTGPFQAAGVGRAGGDGAGAGRFHSAPKWVGAAEQNHEQNAAA